jgi:hypothetical protein
MRYVKFISGTQTIEGSVDMDPAYLAKLSPNKQAMFRPLVTDPQPTPTATQVVMSAGYVIEPTQVRETWSLREKSADEIEDESLVVDRAQIAAALDSINTQLAITNAQVDAMTTAQIRTLVRDDRRIVFQVLRYIARRVKRGM